MDGKVRTPIDAASEAVLTEVHGAYDMTQHTRAASSAQAGRIDADPGFADRFAVIGPPDHCRGPAGGPRRPRHRPLRRRRPVDRRRPRRSEAGAPAFVADVLPRACGS